VSDEKHFECLRTPDGTVDSRSQVRSAAFAPPEPHGAALMLQLRLYPLGCQPREERPCFQLALWLVPRGGQESLGALLGGANAKRLQIWQGPSATLLTEA